MPELTELYAQIAACDRCILAKGREHTVPGEGPVGAQIMFIGEAPGFHENRLGRPFVGAAGHFLDELLASVGMKRSDVYICNVVKCRPPNNREPMPNEIEACRPFLDQQIGLVKPKLIITLGRYSMARFLPRASISKVHGIPTRIGDLVVLPMFHPAAALHQPKYREDIEQDFGRIPSILAQKDTPSASDPVLHAEQLSLF